MTRKLLTDLHNKAFFLPVKLAAINPNYTELSSENTSHSEFNHKAMSTKRTQHDYDDYDLIALVRGSQVSCLHVFAKARFQNTAM